jgi:hypothetical protein
MPTSFRPFGVDLSNRNSRYLKIVPASALIDELAAVPDSTNSVLR